MKTKITTILFVTMISCQLFGQAPIVYINFVSHNEPNDNLQTNLNYQAMKTKVLQLASIIDSKGASWNLQTCDGFARGAWNNESNPVLSNVFKTITVGTYADNIEIDPRSKVSDTSLYNIADTYRYLDTLGCNPTKTLGGFVYYTQNQITQPIDWLKYKDTITAKSFPWKKWKAKLMWGAGSYLPHTNDLNDWGIFKPDTVSYSNTFSAFYNHNTNPNRDLWYIGNGCQPIQALDSTENIMNIITPLKNFIDSIQLGLLPQNKFYVYSITINQKHFGPTQFSQISALCDTINNWGTSKIQWKRLTEKFTLFQNWQGSSGLNHSMWLCGQAVTGITDITEESYFNIFPNPTGNNFQIEFSDNKFHDIKLYDSFGKLLLSNKIFLEKTIDLSEYSKGVFFIRVDNEKSRRIIKN